MELTLKERDRLCLLRQAGEGALSSAEAARRLGVTARHFRRLLAKFRLEGDAAAVHGLRGRPSNRALPRSLRERALDMARDSLREDFGPTLLAEHLERETGRRAGVETLRRWMMQAGLWERRRKRAKHRSRRPRRLAVGELAQWDSSVHRWLEDRYPGELVLISIHDDATNRLMAAKFARKDDGAENRRAIIDYLETHGRPLAVYTDRAGHFGQKRSKGKPRTESIISRALAELGVEMILAGSPQAKGRVERSFGTAQDRLVKEMRVAGISTIEEANRYLERTWMPLWNERFAKEPREPVDAHRPLPEEADLDALFAEKSERVVARDFTVRYKNRHWQIPEAEAEGIAPGTKVVIERRLDGELRFRARGRYIEVEALGREKPRIKPPRREQARRARTPGKPWKPAADHPWRLDIRADVQKAMARKARREARKRLRRERKEE